MIINSKFAYVKKKETFEPLITTIPKGLNPIVFIEDTREMWTCGTYFSIGYPSIEISESSGSVKVSIGNSFFLLSTAGESISVRKGDGNRIIISSNALNRVDTEAPLTWDTANRKLLHMDSGVAPGSYGQSTNLGNASVFIVPNIMVDSTGHITYAQNYNVEIRDYVEQLAPSTLAGNRNVLLSYNADSESMDTSQVRKANGLLFNDSTQRLTVEGGLDTNGPVFVNHGDLSVLDGYIIGHLKGDVEGEAKPKIHLSNKPEYGGASINLYGHVKLQDILNNKPEPSSDNENINDPNITNAIAASPLMVWNAIQTAKDYADSILGSNNAMLYKGSIEAGITYPGTYTPIGQIGNTYVVTFGSGNYIDSVGYVNGEPVEVGDLIICKEETPAATSTTWETVKSKWTYVQTNNTGVVSGPSSSTIGQLAVFNNTKGKLIKGLPNGNVGQILSIDESGIPAWVNKPDRLNFALSFQVRGTEFIAFDGYEPKKVNFIAGDNMFITSDMQGNLTLAADPGSDTVNTAGATNNPNTKLFLIGAESQTTAPQTYSNQYVYIGPDNKLYSNGKEVSTTDHTHNYAGAKTPGGPALKIDLNPDGLLDAEYGTYGGIIQDSNNGPTSGSWSNRIKILHNNSSGYYTELAQNLTGTAGVWHRRNVAGVISEWIPLLDKSNFHTYLDETYIQKQTDPNQLKNFVRYSLESGLTINWTAGNVTPTQVIGFKENNSAQSYTFNGDNIRAFANAVNRSGDTMSGNLTTTGIILTTTTGITHNGKSSALLYCDGTNSFVGMSAATTYIRSGNTDLFHKKNGTDYKIWDASNDGSGSGLDADLLDGVQLTRLVHYADDNAYDNTSCSRIIPISNVTITDNSKYGSIFQWTNITTQTPAQTGTSGNWFNQLYGGTNDRLYFRTRTNGGDWTSWHKIAFITDNVASATKADYPTGFSSRSTYSSTWGNTTGTHITGWTTSTGGDIAFMNDNPSAGKVSIKIDGLFYQDEGRYKVLDTNNYPSTLDSRYLLKGSAVNTSNNSSWLSFANNAGGVGGTMGVNDQWRIYGRSTADNAGYLEIATADDGNEPIYFRQYTGVFSTLKRTLTLLDGSGNTSIPGSLTVAGTTTSGNFNTGGRYISNYASNTYINSVTNAVLTCNYSGYGGILCAPVKGGRITLSTYPSNDNIVYLGYATSSQISAGTNTLNKQTKWNADNGYWYTDGYVKNGSSNSYVLLGGGGHTTLSGLYTSHNHFERSNVDPNSVVNGPRTYESTSTANRPDTNKWHQYTTMGTGDSNYCHQLSYAYAGGTNIYHRIKNAGSWGGWMTILDSSNYAGILDGRYVNVTGDTMTGKLTIQSSSLNGTYNGLLVGDDCNIGDCNIGNTIGLMGTTNNNAGMIKFGKGGYQFGYNGSSHYVSGTNIWTNFNADLLDGLHASSFVRVYTGRFSQYNKGTWTKILQFTIPNGSLRPSITFTWHPTECARDIWADFNINIRSGSPTFYANWKGGNRRNMYCVGDGTTYSVWVQGTKTTWDPYGLIQVTSTWDINSYQAGSLQYSDSEPSGTYKAAASTSGFVLYADRLLNSRQINGTNFNGTANITTAKWGTARSIKIGNTAKNVDGSGNVTWTFAEIGGADAGHTHGLLHNNFTTILANTTTDSGWSMINGSYNGFILKSLRMQGSAPSWVLGNYAAGICFGGADTKGVISVAYGSAQIRVAGGNSSKPLWSCDLWHNKNFNPNTKFNTSGGTISGAVTINNTLSVSKIKATSTYSSNYVFCADGSIRNFPTLFSTNILWASYKVNTGGSGSYSRLSGNYNFITGRTREGTGRLIVTISVPSGYSKTQIMMFATGHHFGRVWTSPVYASIQPDYGGSSSFVRIMTADDASLNDAECIVNFILVKTS